MWDIQTKSLEIPEGVVLGLRIGNLQKKREEYMSVKDIKESLKDFREEFGNLLEPVAFLSEKNPNCRYASFCNIFEGATKSNGQVNNLMEEKVESKNYFEWGTKILLFKLYFRNGL